MNPSLYSAAQNPSVFPPHPGTPIPGSIFLKAAPELPYLQAVVTNTTLISLTVHFCSPLALAFYSLTQALPVAERIHNRCVRTTLTPLEALSYLYVMLILSHTFVCQSSRQK